MNIHYVNQRFPELSQTFVYDQMRYLRHCGHRVSISCIKMQNKDRDLIDYDFYDELLHVPSSGFFQRPVNLFSANKKHRKYSVFAKQLVVKFSKSGAIPDILVAHFGPNVVLGSYVKKELLNKFNLNIPLVGVFHGYDLSEYLQKHGNQAYQNFEPYIDRFITISDYWRKLLLQIGVPEAHVKTIRLGVRSVDEAVKPTKTDKIIKILSVGRMVEKKGFDDLISAFSIIRKNNGNAVLEIVGDGPEWNERFNQAKNLELGDSIVFSGALSHSQVLDRICKSDIFVLASKIAANGDMEGIPVVLMEAMSCNIPVVSTYHSGIPELIENNVTGLLVAEGAPEELAQAVLKLIEYPENAYTLACNARLTVRKNYNQDAQNVLFETELQALVSTTNGG